MAIATSDALPPSPGLTIPYDDLIGAPFRLGARGPDAFDCYGLVMELMRRAGASVPDYRSPQVMEEVAASIGRQMPHWTPCEPEPGAVATIRLGEHISHVGIVLPFDRMIHSWERSGGVCVERLHTWRRLITGYYRFQR
jgi:cell wall-associated NlpC family hydrolase